MIIKWEEFLPQLYFAGGVVILFFMIALLAKVLINLLTPYSIDHELTTSDNPALSASFAGYLAGVAIIFAGTLQGPSRGWMNDLIAVGGYSLLGVVLLNLSRWINDKCILYRFSNTKEIIQDRNVGTGVVQAGSFIASGFIIAGAVHGEGGNPLTTILFFLLGQLVLILFTALYNKITPFDIHQEIEKNNTAAGLAFGGTLIALGIILMKGTSGNFVNWTDSLAWFAIDTVLAFLILPIARLFFDKIIIRGADLNHEITTDQNIGAGLLEMTTAISFATILFFMI